MSRYVAELYDVLRSMGADEAAAHRAASAVLSRDDLSSFATRQDLAELKIEILQAITQQTRWIVTIIFGTLTLMTGIFSAIVVWIR